MGVLFVLFAIAMAVATFLENDFGSSAAYNMVYNTRWFELILLLLALNLVGQIVILKLFKKEKLTIALFHLSFITYDYWSWHYQVFRMGRHYSYP